MTTELKPCPFCGGNSRIVTVGGGNRSIVCHFATCNECGASSGYTYKSTPEAAIAAWNQRAGDADTERLDSRQIIIGNCWWTDVDLRAAIDAARKDGAK